MQRRGARWAIACKRGAGWWLDLRFISLSPPQTAPPCRRGPRGCATKRSKLLEQAAAICAGRRGSSHAAPHCHEPSPSTSLPSPSPSQPSPWSLSLRLRLRLRLRRRRVHRVELLACWMSSCSAGAASSAPAGPLSLGQHVLSYACVCASGLTLHALHVFFFMSTSSSSASSSSLAPCPCCPGGASSSSGGGSGGCSCCGCRCRRRCHRRSGGGWRTGSPAATCGCATCGGGCACCSRCCRSCRCSCCSCRCRCTSCSSGCATCGARGGPAPPGWRLRRIPTPPSSTHCCSAALRAAPCGAS